ncbi:ABC transporter permease [Nonomuraea harbinensis]|uniref:ABC transporter permease n=1 Tax=Nonomuraea harbinensis TaxID=1286938 RepID=A0ABW1C1L3_9ACTN|nr:ABC transporter permease [Nonomuraea harbinensis]
MSGVTSRERRARHTTMPPAPGPRRRRGSGRRWRGYRAVVSFAGFLVVWHVAAEYLVANPLFLAGPISTVQAVGTMWADGTLQQDLLVSADEFLKGFGAGLVAGVLLGLLLGTSRRAKDYIDPLINGLYATPLVALAPLFILWFGIGETKTVLLVFMLVVLPIAINTDAGIRATDPQHLEAARSFGASRLQLFTMVRFPTSVSFLVAGIRMGIGRGLIGVVVGELFGSQSGLGYRILVSSQYFQTDVLLAGVLIFSVTGVLLVKIFEWLERRVAPWQSGQG